MSDNMLDESIIIRQITSDDKLGLSLLYDEVWPENRGNHFNKTSWAIDTSDFKGICATANGKIIGSRACFRSNLFLGREKLTCVQFGDSCVDKDYRRLGLFSRMNKAFIEDFFVTGNEIIYNISVDASRKAYEKLGWVYIKSMSNLIRIPHPLVFLFKTKGDFRRLAGNIKIDPFPIPELSSISETLIANRERLFGNRELIHGCYDRETLRWRLDTDSGIRFFYKDGVGACLYKTGQKNGLRCCIIGEVFLVDYSRRCFRKMIKALEASNCFDVVSVAVTHAHPLYRLYRRMGFLINPFKPFLNHGVRVSSEKMKDICYNPANWAISTLDIDTF